MILGPYEIHIALKQYIKDCEGIEIPETATIDARVRSPGSWDPETYLIVSWDVACGREK